MGTHLYDSFHSLERILEGNQETRKEVLTMFGGHVEFNGCKTLHQKYKYTQYVKKRKRYIFCHNSHNFTDNNFKFTGNEE